MYALIDVVVFCAIIISFLNMCFVDGQGFQTKEAVKTFTNHFKNSLSMDISFAMCLQIKQLLFGLFSSALHSGSLESIPSLNWKVSNTIKEQWRSTHLTKLLGRMLQQLFFFFAIGR